MSEEKQARFLTGFKPHITYSQLGLLLLFFLFGYVANDLLEKIVAGGTTQFTALSLIGFVLSVLLAGASIVLAVTAIVLGKTSEQAMTLRSDESIRLQNEVFTKTTEALQRIEASTGVTEKRIEDIISGRVVDISENIAELAIKGKPKDREALEEQIKQSILREIRAPFSEEDAKKEEEKRRIALEKRREHHRKYKEFLDKTLISLTNIKTFVSEKIGEGNIRGIGDELYDGIFRVNDKRLGFCIFLVDNPHDIMDAEYILTLANQIA